MAEERSGTDWLVGGGAMGDHVRAKDWSKTPLGPIEHWPQSLRTTVSLCLASNFPISIAWGSERTQIYNNGYWPICGAKHPHSMGQDFKECWFSAWPAIGEAFERASAGETRFLVNQRMFLDRNGYLEETFFTFSFSPIRDESGGVGGLFHPVTELTQQTLAERRLKVLRDVADQASDAHSVAEAAGLIADALAQHELDLPFVLLYLVDAEAGSARLAARTGLGRGADASPAVVDLADPSASSWPLADAAQTRQIQQVDDLERRFGALRCEPYPESPNTAIVMPISIAGLDHTFALLVAGVSPRRALDDPYRTFYALLGDAVTNALTGARAYEEEKRRAEALAELDRAKTAFFSNVSHEFRIPLTLMLGPLEDMLHKEKGVLPDADHAKLDMVHRNGLRLLKLVNTLLDFSRIEAGRIQASYEPTDLATFTADLAGVFRSAIEKAGMRLVVDCPPLPEPIYVDREMWEKIVLNLLSNAFKFTFQGEIAVILRRDAGRVELAVRDTGTGIPAHELPHVFERFHRVKGAQGRTHEGSGIGLALVRELAHLHGGEARVESAEGEGSTFRIVIPTGTAHLPAERLSAARTLASTATGAGAFIEEALRWLPGSESHGTEDLATTTTASLSRESLAGLTAARETDAAVGGRVLVVDDNADMRGYVRRRLAAHYDVEAAPDGLAALAAVGRNLPDLVLADVMMPGLDGFGLLRELRTRDDTRDVPVIMLSARAGEESKIEGLAAGADDYLVKPFSARELLARVEAHLKLKRLREQSQAALRESEKRFRQMADHAPVMIWVTDPDGICTFLSKSWYEFTGRAEAEGQLGWDAIHPDDRQEVRQTFVAANVRHESFRSEYRLRRRDGEYRWVIDAAAPRFSDAGEFLGYIGTVIDISERKQAETTRQLLLGELNHRVKNTLASVQAIVQHTLRRTKDPVEFANSFAGRIQSLSRVHSLLTSATWQGADLRELIRDQLLDGTIDEARITAWGPSVRLEPQMTLHLALMLHELGTNSSKYGALSVPGGWITISWTVKDSVLHLIWVERGGPAVAAPTARGFGTTLIEQSAKGEGGHAQMICEAGGITWEIALPLPRPASPPQTRFTAPAPELVTPAQSSQTNQANEVRANLAGRCFLVVEDEPLVALDLAAGLEGAGATVAGPVGTDAEALRMIEEVRIDAALLDANLRGEPVDQIAAALARRNVPFVFVTGYGRENLPLPFQNANVLAKPFSVQQLIETAAQLVRKSGNVVRLKQ
jgi:PAS domain S-box-containing protein